MSETQPFTLWSELAFLTLGRRNGDQGKECGNFEPRGTYDEEVWVLQKTTAT